MTIAPERIEVEIAARESIVKKLRVFNDGLETILVTPLLEELFPPLSERVDIVRSSSRRLTSEFLSYNPDTIKLDPGAWLDFPLEIQVPATAKPGGYYGTFFFQFIEQTAPDVGIGIVGKVGTVILLSVIGPVEASAEFVGLEIEGRSGGLFDHLPARVSFKLKNTGDVHLIPDGTLTITNWFGRVREELSVNADRRVLLPGWTRMFEEVLATAGRKGWFGEWQRMGFGQYRLKLILQTGRETIQQEVQFWVIPWRSVGLAVLVLAALCILRSLATRRGHHAV